MKASFAQLLRQALSQNHLPEEALAQLTTYLELMTQWNRTYNLTAITDPKEMVYLHIIDSLLVGPSLKGPRCLDIGSGAGLPGIPLAIAHPETHWVLLDKNSKKTHFLVQVVAELGLKNVEVIHARCEDFHPSMCFDSILARAVGTIRLFVTVNAHLLCADGIFIAMKGKLPATELQELPAGFETSWVKPIRIVGVESERHIIGIVKRT